jgi:hypothetical protein
MTPNDERDAAYRELLRRHAGGVPRLVGYEELLETASRYRVTVLGGYSGLGYENQDVVRSAIESIVASNGDHNLYVLGGTKDGIGAAYVWIRNVASSRALADVKTAGIVSLEAVRYPESIAEQDYLVFVDTDVGDWEVKRNGISLMVDVAHRTGGEMVYFKGGAISGAEIAEALARGVGVTLYSGADIQPDPAKLEKKRKSDPGHVADGTAKLASANRERPERLLKIIS